MRIGTHTITNEQVAIKILEKDKIKDKADVERVTREINILKKVRHPNVIQLYEVRQSVTDNYCRLSKRQDNCFLLWSTLLVESYLNI